MAPALPLYGPDTPDRPIPVPQAADLQDILTALLSLDVTVTIDHPRQLVEVVPGALVVYLSERNRIGVAAYLDVGFVNRVGAALVRITPAIAEHEVRAGRVGEDLGPNTHALMRVLGRLLNSQRSVVLRPSDLHALPGPLPGEFRELDRTATRRFGFQVDVGGYGTGHVTFVYAPAAPAS